ncbi:MAG: AtpZ/AtpI family protein [Pseudomonadota bacterium]
MAGSNGDKFPGDPEAGDGSTSDLADFEARLRKTQKAYQQPVNNAARGTAMGIAFRLTTELVAGIIVGGGIGLLLDKWLGTGPLFLLIFFFLGMAAGILNVLKTARQMSAQAELDAKSDNQGS